MREKASRLPDGETNFDWISESRSEPAQSPLVPEQTASLPKKESHDYASPLKEFIELVKKRLVELIIQELRENTIEVAQAQKCAGDFLALEPFKDKEDVLEGLKSLDYSITKQLYTEALGSEEEFRRKTQETSD